MNFPGPFRGKPQGDPVAGLLVAPAPHLHAGATTASLMLTMTAALLPAGAWGVYVFGLAALRVILVSVGTALAAEALAGLLRRRFTLADGSALVTGLLVAYGLPPSVPLFIPAVASAFAILVVKQAFGGLGHNWMNPALAARVFVLFSWPGPMGVWPLPRTLAADALAGPTPLGLVRGSLPGLTGPAGGPLRLLAARGYPVSGLDTAVTGWLVRTLGIRLPSGYFDLLLGNAAGCIGEISALLLLLGGAVLLARRVVSWEVPAAYLASFGVLVGVFGGLRLGDGPWSGDVFFHLLSGGLLLGALFMATDPVSTPLTRRGLLLFGAGAGLLTFLFRFYGSFPEGVAPAVILMNLFVPLIDRATKPTRFGADRAAKVRTA